MNTFLTEIKKIIHSDTQHNTSVHFLHRNYFYFAQIAKEGDGENIFWKFQSIISKGCMSFSIHISAKVACYQAEMIHPSERNVGLLFDEHCL